VLQDAAVRMHVHMYICRLNAAEQARRGAAGAAPARAPGLTPGACRAGMLAGRAPVKTVSAHEPTLLALRRVLAAASAARPSWRAAPAAPSSPTCPPATCGARARAGTRGSGSGAPGRRSLARRVAQLTARRAADGCYTRLGLI